MQGEKGSGEASRWAAPVVGPIGGNRHLGTPSPFLDHEKKGIKGPAKKRGREKEKGRRPGKADATPTAEKTPSKTNMPPNPVSILRVREPNKRKKKTKTPHYTYILAGVQPKNRARPAGKHRFRQFVSVPEEKRREQGRARKLKNEGGKRDRN